MEFKYISVFIANETYGREIGERIFIFPKEINHDEFYRGVSRLHIYPDWNQKDRISENIVGAGFTDLVTCYGRSETLRIDSRGEADTLLLGQPSTVKTHEPTPEPKVNKKKSALEQSALKAYRNNKQRKG